MAKVVRRKKRSVETEMCFISPQRVGGRANSHQAFFETFVKSDDPPGPKSWPPAAATALVMAPIFISR